MEMAVLSSEATGHSLRDFLPTKQMEENLATSSEQLPGLLGRELYVRVCATAVFFVADCAQLTFSDRRKSRLFTKMRKSVERLWRAAVEQELKF